MVDCDSDGEPRVTVETEALPVSESEGMEPVAMHVGLTDDDADAREDKVLGDGDDEREAELDGEPLAVPVREGVGADTLEVSLAEADGEADTLGDHVPVHDRESVGDGDADREPRLGVDEAVGGVSVRMRVADWVVLPGDRLRGWRWGSNMTWWHVMGKANGYYRK